MKKEYYNLLKYWLEIDFMFIANKAGFLSQRLEVEPAYVNDTVHMLDKMTRDKKIDKNIVITLLALLWEHADKDEYDIRQVALLFLSRIGYPTSAIICDEGFDKDNCLFSPVHSLIHELSIMAHQEKNEVKVCGKTFLLTDYQKRIWDAFESEKKLVGISAPTSAGKSFVISLKIMAELSRGNIDVVYIVPTLSPGRQRKSPLPAISARLTSMPLFPTASASQGTRPILRASALPSPGLSSQGAKSEAVCVSAPRRRAKPMSSAGYRASRPAGGGISRARRPAPVSPARFVERVTAQGTTPART